MIDLTIEEITRSAGGEWLGDPALLSARPADVVTDSRDAGRGSLFIAIRGERTDGHRYIPDVFAKGALAVLCSEKGAEGESRILTADVMDALRSVAAYSRSRFSCPFIGVTGSVGKTTAKEMIAAALSARFDTFRTPGSLNGQIGLPVSMMQLRSGTEAAVVEMGVSLFGEMSRLSELVRPDHAVITNIGDAHLEAFRDREGILREKAHIIDRMAPNGAVFVNGDDALLSAASFGRRTVRFGLGENCDIRAEDIRHEQEEFTCRITAPGAAFRVRVPAYGNYMVYSVLAAAAVGLELGMSGSEIAEGLTTYSTDCYNANPTSNRAAIDSMFAFPGRKVCILGDMREMGAVSEKVHREIGRYAAERGVSAVMTYGEEARRIAEGAGGIAVHFDRRADLLAALADLILPGDVVLVKASHGPNFADIVEAIENLDK